MLSFIVGLGFILLGVLPYGYINFWLLKDYKKFQVVEYHVSKVKK